MHDGFISIRDDCLSFARELKSNLRTHYDLEAVIQSELGSKNRSSHVIAARDSIREAKFVVIVVGKNDFNSPSPDKPCFQEVEVMEALGAHKERADGDNPLDLFFVNLTDDDSHRTIEAFWDLIEGVPLVGGREFPNFFSAPSSPARRDAQRSTVQKIVANIHDILSDQGYEAVVTKADQHAPKDAFVPDDLTDYERRYLNARIDLWLKGHHEEVELATGDTPADVARRKVFEFEPSRGLVVDATERRTAASKDNSQVDVEASPIMARLAAPSDDPVFVFGDAGSGKTTALTLTAALYASQIDPAYHKGCDALLSCSVGQEAKLSNDKTFMPVVIQCAILAERLPQHQHEVSDTYASFMAYLVELFSVSELDDAPTAEDLQKRMEARGYVLIFDALDEVIQKDKQDSIVALIRRLSPRYGARDRQNRIILSARQPHYSNNGVFRQFELRPLSKIQVRDYFSRFVNALELPRSETIGQIARLETVFENDRQFSDLLTLPFNLNCFCFLAGTEQNHGAESRVPSSQVGLIAMLVKNLIENVRFEGILDQAISAEMFRATLRRLAHEALAKNSKGVIKAETAITICRHTLSSLLTIKYDNHLTPEIKPEQAKAFLSRVVKETDLLSYSTHENRYEFKRKKICEYLAGERLDVDAFSVSFLRALDVEYLEQLKQSFAFCYALRMQRNVVDHASNILKEMASRAAGEFNKPAPSEENILDALEWLTTAIYCATVGADAVPDKAIRDGRLSGFEEVKEKTIDFLKEHANAVHPNQRHELLRGLMKLCQCSDPMHTVDEVHAVLNKLTGQLFDWLSSQSIPLHDEDNATQSHVDLFAAPVMVCEYLTFMEDLKSDPEYWEAEGIWDHAPVRYRKTLLHESASPADLKAPIEYWNELRGNLAAPITRITWYEAVAYARWLTVTMRKRDKLHEGQFIRLPSLNELQAVYFRPAVKFPWGDELGEQETARANYRLAGINDVSTLGTFPAYRSRFLDFGSNVRCWTVTSDEDHAPEWPPAESDKDYQAVAGHDWWSSKEDVQRRKPTFPTPFERDGRFGLRLVRDEIKLKFRTTSI